MPFDRSNRTYHVSDERLRAFRALSPEEKLCWVEQLAAFIRLSQPAESAVASKSGKQDRPAETGKPLGDDIQGQRTVRNTRVSSV